MPHGRGSPRQGRQAFRILHVAFVVAPVLAGLDKFFDVLAEAFGPTGAAAPAAVARQRW